MGAGSGTSAGDSLSSQLGNYTAPIPDIVNMYNKNLTGGLINAPTFEQMFSSYAKLGEKEANRQSAATTEAFGSQGARYSSDLQVGQGQIRSNLMDQLMSQAAQYQLGLRQQQSTEAGAVGNLLYGANEAGMNRYFQDFLRRTSPPPIFGAAQNQTQSYGLPGTVV